MMKKQKKKNTTAVLNIHQVKIIQLKYYIIERTDQRKENQDYIPAEAVADVHFPLLVPYD